MQDLNRLIGLSKLAQGHIKMVENIVTTMTKHKVRPEKVRIRSKEFEEIKTSVKRKYPDVEFKGFHFDGVRVTSV